MDVTTFIFLITAIMRGDPHFTTLDGKEFTFNGWGEYTLANIILDGSEFLAQGRTHPVEEGSLNATQFVAFAFGRQDSKVEVRLTLLASETMIIVNSHYCMASYVCRGLERHK